jgi:type II secretory pathway pseudopilin PulG
MMPLDESKLANTSSLEILAKFFVPVTIAVIALILVYILYRWKIGFDKRSLESLKSEKMRLRMEALAAEKKALRKAQEQNRNKGKIDKPEKPEKPKDDFGDEEILQF